MAGASRKGFSDKYIDPNSWLGKLLISEITNDKRHLAGHCGSARIKPGKKIKEDGSFGGYSEKELKKRGIA